MNLKGVFSIILLFLFTFLVNAQSANLMMSNLEKEQLLVSGIDDKRKVSDAALKQGDSLLLAETFQYIGSWHYVKETLDSAHYYLNSALHIYQKFQKEKGEFQSNYLLGLIYSDVEDSLNVRKACLRSIENGRKLNSIVGVAANQLLLAKEKNLNGHFNEALTIIDEAIDSVSPNDIVPESMDMLMKLWASKAEILYKLKEYDKVIEAEQESVFYGLNSGFGDAPNGKRVAMVRSLIELNRLEEAFSILDQLKYQLVEFDKEKKNLQYLILSADLAIKMENFDLFQENYTEAKELLKTVKAPKLAREIEELMLQYYKNNDDQSKVEIQKELLVEVISITEEQIEEEQERKEELMETMEEQREDLLDLIAYQSSLRKKLFDLMKENILLSLALFLLVLSGIGGFLWLQKKKVDKLELLKASLKDLEWQKSSEHVQLMTAPDNITDKLYDQEDLFLRLSFEIEQEELFKDPAINLSILSVKLDSDPANISETVKELMGMDFQEFISVVRVRKAQELFVSSETNSRKIEEISISLGFESKQNFIRAFKKQTGVSPAFFKANVLNVAERK